MKRILFAFGTRPEAIKMAPLILGASQFQFEPLVLTTGQHREMIKSSLDFFKIPISTSFECMKEGQSLSELTSRVLSSSDKVIKDLKPDYVCVQGDTTSAFACGLAGFLNKIPVLHIEAGLRTYDNYSPFPEEVNRKLLTQFASFHFAPTEKARIALENEGVTKNVFVTGNTGIDALRLTRTRLSDQLYSSKYPFLSEDKKNILITTHRRENHGAPLENICGAIKFLAQKFTDVCFIFPVHLNPAVHAIAKKNLGSLKNVILLPPMDYPDFVWMLSKATIILTDSGGVQEEAPYFKKPILVLRENTERQEGVDAGTAILVGADQQKIISNIERLMADNDFYQSFTHAKSPFGDGFASEKIFKALFGL